MDEVSKDELLQRYSGAMIALTGIYESLAHIQMFLIDQLWPEGKELDAAADTLEGVKRMIMVRQQQIIEAAEGLEDGNSEE